MDSQVHSFFTDTRNTDNGSFVLKFLMHCIRMDSIILPRFLQGAEQTLFKQCQEKYKPYQPSSFLLNNNLLLYFHRKVVYREQYYPHRMKFGMYMSANAVTWSGNNNGEPQPVLSRVKSQSNPQEARRNSSFISLIPKESLSNRCVYAQWDHS